jgi:hypothetical protein
MSKTFFVTFSGVHDRANERALLTKILVDRGFLTFCLGERLGGRISLRIALVFEARFDGIGVGRTVEGFPFRGE